MLPETLALCRCRVVGVEDLGEADTRAGRAEGAVLAQAAPVTPTVTVDLVDTVGGSFVDLVHGHCSTRRSEADHQADSRAARETMVDRVRTRMRLGSPELLRGRQKVRTGRGCGAPSR
jgi:hypothetical protein